MLTLRTSQPPMPRTLAPGRAVAISRAIFSVFSTLRPTMHALAPSRTRARVCMLQIVPAPPVTKTTRLSGRVSLVARFQREGRGCSLKMPSFHTGLRYSDSGTGMMCCFLLLSLKGWKREGVLTRVSRFRGLVSSVYIYFYEKIKEETK